MFASTYKEDPTRKTFLDLPSEIRNVIYEIALIGPHWKLGIVGPEGKIRPRHPQYLIYCHGCDPIDTIPSEDYHLELIMASLSLLSAVKLARCSGQIWL
jgi:hypothetical protein